MKKLHQIFSIAGYNFRLWRKNPRIIVTFALAFVMCFLLSDNAYEKKNRFPDTGAESSRW